jgi:3-hydroxyisobutyrate dehydrogenase-like beta-hydroxyacid dehydrogenase
MTGKVGFVGVGAMRGPMALNLVKAGFEVIVHDINADRIAALAEAGARVVDSPAAAAECRHTICMVETADQAEAVIFGSNGFVQNAQPRDIVICMSTIDPVLARQFAERLADKSIAMLDAPVSGGRDDVR